MDNVADKKYCLICGTWYDVSMICCVDCDRQLREFRELKKELKYRENIDVLVFHVAPVKKK